VGGSEATARRNSDDVRFMRETLHKLTQLVSDLLPRKGSLCLFGCFAMHTSGSCYYCLPVDRFLGDLAPVSRAFPSQSRALVLSPPRSLPRSPFSRTGLRSHHCRVQVRFPTKTLRRIHRMYANSYRSWGSSGSYSQRPNCVFTLPWIVGHSQLVIAVGVSYRSTLSLPPSRVH